MSTISQAEATRILGAINSIPETADLVIEVKHALRDSIHLQQKLAMNLLRDRLDPSVIVNADVVPKRFLFRIMIDVLTAHGIEVARKNGESIVMDVINTLYNTPELAAAKSKELELLEIHIKGMATTSIIAGNQSAPGTGLSRQDARATLPHNNGDITTESMSRKLNSASSVFRDSSKRFSGSYESKLSLYRFKQLLKATCEQYCIPPNHCIGLLTNALEGVALDFHLENIHGKVSTLKEAFELLDSRFDSPHSRAQAQSYLESMTMESIRQSERCSTARALEVAQLRINSVAPMCGPEFANQSHKARWLANMLRGEQWAQQCCIARITQAQDYATFLAALNAALTQLAIAVPDSIPTPRSYAKTTQHQPEMAHTTLYGKQYATPIRRNRQPPPLHRGRPRRTAYELQNIKQRTRCLKCGQRGHWRAECPNRNLSMTDAIQSRLNTTPPELQDTLIAMAHDEDEYLAYKIDTELADNISNDEEENWLSKTNDSPFDTLIDTLDIAPTEPAETNFTNLVYDMPLINTRNGIMNQLRTPGIGTLAIPLAQENQKSFQIHFCTTRATPNITLMTRADDPSFESFKGALVDTGAQKTVIGRQQAFDYFVFSKQKPQFTPTNVRFRFGKNIFTANNRIIITIPTPANPIVISVDVVDAPIPFLLGMDVMRAHHLQPLIINQRIENIVERWSVPLTIDDGHLYWRWSPQTKHTQSGHTTHHNTHSTNPTTNPMSIDKLVDPSPATQLDTPQSTTTPKTQTDAKDPGNPLSVTELKRVHRHFAHASARKLYELLKRSTLQTPPNTLDELNKIVAACETCSEFSPRSISFKVRMPDAVVFNHRILLDLVWLPARNPMHTRRTRPALHIVNAGTKFNAATFVTGESTAEIWNAFIRSWAMLYIGMPTSMLVDQGSAFLSDEWKFACEINGIELTAVGTESHNSLGAGEAFHSYLRRTYNKVHSDFPRLDDATILSLSVKAINDCAGPRGLCPTLLVFGVLPQLPVPSKQDHATQTERYRAAALARNEYERIVSAERIRLAARKPPPPAAKLQFAPGDMVFVYRERLKQFTGPHMIASIHGKQARLHVGEKTGPREFNLSQLRPSSLPNSYIDGNSDPTYPTQILHTEIISPNDPRSKLFDQAKKQELLGLLEKGTFKIVLAEEAGPNPNILPCRYVLAIKHSESSSSPTFKARFVIGGHRDRHKDLVVHNSTTIRPENVRLLLALATILALPISLADWKQGYVQSKSQLLRKVFTKPKELQLAPNELVQVIRPLYGLPDAGEYWNETLSNHLREHCQFQQSTTDFCLWIRTTAQKLLALATTYVDDVLIAATPDALERFKAISLKRFDVKFDSSATLSYLGLQINTQKDGTRKVAQPKQIRRLRLLPSNASFDEFRSARASMAWLQQTRPDICCAISFQASVTESNFSTESIRAHNKVVQYLRDTADWKLQYPRLDTKTLRITTYVDAAHRNRSDIHSQIGYIICLADASNKCAIISFVSRKSKRIARSTTTGEALAFAAGFDASFAIQKDLSMMLGRRIPIIILTDSEILFNSIIRRRCTTERRLMVDLYIARAAFEAQEISNIALIDSDDNPADALTKLKPNTALRDLLYTGMLNQNVKQYVIDPDKIAAP